MKIGLVIPVFNRPNYVSECLKSLLRVETSEDVSICIVNDGSTDEHIEPLLSSFRPTWATVEVVKVTPNQGISKALQLGLLRLKAKGCSMFINLDSDAIVKPEFIDTLLDLKLRFKHDIVSGFNTHSVDRKTGAIRHKTIKTEDDCVVKSSIGGINMAFTVDQYNTMVMGALKTPGHWDWNLCRKVKSFIVTRPSIVQHIGVDEGKHMDNPDTAYDFD